MVSAIMQAVSDDGMAIAGHRGRPVGLIYGSQTIEMGTGAGRVVKDYKAGFVTSDANLSPSGDAGRRGGSRRKSTVTTMPVTEDGSAHGKLVGVVTDRDYRCRAACPWTRR